MPRLDEAGQIAVVLLRLLNDDLGRGDDNFIFVGSKSACYPLTGALPQFEVQATS